MSNFHLELVADSDGVDHLRRYWLIESRGRR